MRYALLAFLLAAGALSNACSDEAPPPAGTSSGFIAPPSSSAGFDAGGPDAASITPRPDLCDQASISAGGAEVPELELAGDPPPPLGGVVAEGIYDLASTSTYAPRGPIESDGGDGEEVPSTRKTGNAAQVTIVVTKFEMRVLAARGRVGALEPPTRTAFLYRTEGTDIVRTQVCPTTALPARIGYSAVNGGLTIYADATHREVYTRRSP